MEDNRDMQVVFGDEEADYCDVKAGSGDMRTLVYRFAKTEKGVKRAQQYVRSYNNSLREAMGLTREDVYPASGHEWPEGMSTEEYDRRCRIESYYDHCAQVVYGRAIPVIGDNDPMPTDYPHDY